MDLQHTFYLLGIIIFSLGIIFWIVLIIAVLVLVSHYKKFVRDSKEKVARFKRGVSAIPFLPMIGYFMRNFLKRKGR